MGYTSHAIHSSLEMVDQSQISAFQMSSYVGYVSYSLSFGKAESNQGIW